jgi:hypothetical protein
VTEEPIDLDRRRGADDQAATDIRRLRVEVEMNQDSLRKRRNEFERFLVAAPSRNWFEATEKARYVFGLFSSDVTNSNDSRKQRLINSVLSDFDRLLDETPPHHDNDR